MEEQRGPIERIKRRPAKYAALAGLMLIVASLANLFVLSLGVRGQITWLGVKLSNSLVEAFSVIGALVGILIFEVGLLLALRTINASASNPDAPPESN
jgi:hypothetical protein